MNRTRTGASRGWLALLPLALLAAGASAQEKPGSVTSKGIVGPVLYSTYVGGCRGVMGVQDVLVDATGHAYFTGQRPWDCDRGGADVIIGKVSPKGELLFLQDQIGGHLDDEGKAIALDAKGNIYITGSTNGSCCRPFPLVDPFQAERGGGGDGFVIKLDPTGEEILYSTFLGGGGDDWGVDIAVDDTGRILVAGRTRSQNFPVADADQPGLGGAEDAFLTVFDPTGQQLVFSTYLGGGGDDSAVRMELAGGQVFVAGSTSSIDFPVQGTPVQPVYGGGGADAWLARYALDGTLGYATYFGGSGRDEAQALALHRDHVYLTGHTDSPDFPTVVPLQPALSRPPEPDAFVARLTAGGTQVHYSTYLATPVAASCVPTETGTPVPCGGIDIDSRGAAYVTANGTFVTKITPAGDARAYTFHGSGGAALALGGEPAVHVAGLTKSFAFPTVNAPHSNHTFHQEEIGWLFKRADGVNPQAAFEEDDPRITTTGTWELVQSPGLSGGAALRSNEPGAQLVLTYQEPSIRVYGRRDQESGSAVVSEFPPRTGTPPAVGIDTFASVPEDRSLIYARSTDVAEERTLTFEVTGDGWFWFDGFTLE